ncbi:MAG: hypothetical protein RL186_869 [Pseudomonadota bacterium]|jgi:flagellar assembly protein FliH
MNSFTSTAPDRPAIVHEFEPMFDRRKGRTEFSGPDRRKALTEQDIIDARAQGFEQGYAQAQISIEQVSSTALTAIAANMNLMLDRLLEEAQTLRNEATHVAMIAARVIAGRALDAFGAEAVADILATTAAQLKDTPRLVVRVAPELAEIIEARLIGCAREAGFSGEIAVRADPDALAGDCTLDWGEGTIVYSREAALAAIDQAAQNWLQSAQTEGL